MKHIIIGIDGTWRAAFKNAFDSNVHRLNLSMSHKDANGNAQVFIYSAGLGTAGTTSKLTAGFFAEGIDESVLQAYINLCSNYEPGDKIYLFGFSRGAVAVRALCAFIDHAGLLKSSSTFMVRRAWRNFTGKETDELDEHYDDLVEERHTHEDTRIEFLGVWDTVFGPVRRANMLKRFRFENLVPEKNIKHAVQILAIDDMRWSFAPVLWSHDEERDDQQTVEQIWMPGVHSDVGGGSSASFLSTLSLLLMIDKLAARCPELAFEQRYIRRSLLARIEGKKARIVLNNERLWLSPYSWGGWPRTIANDKALHTEHPITKLLRDREMTMRQQVDFYSPSYQVAVDRPPLQDTELASTSWYMAEAARIVEKKISELKPRPKPKRRDQS